MRPVRMITAWLALAATAASCGGPGDGGEPQGQGLMGSTIFFPYPNIQLMSEDSASPTGWRVSIPPEVMPVPEGGTIMDVGRFDRLDGFSPASPCVAFFEDAQIDPATLPGVHDIESSLLPASPIQIIDLATGERHPLMAELDAHPQAIGDGRRALVIRPMKAFNWASHYAVVITEGVKDTSGASLEAPAPFRALVTGSGIPDDLAPYAGHYDGLFSRLEEIGLVIEDVVLAWDFWTGSHEATHAQIDHIVRATTEDIPADPAFVPEYFLRETRCLDSDVDTDVDPLIWRHTELEFSMVTFVDEQGMFVVGEDGMPVEQGRDDYLLIIHLPPSIHDAPAGSVPVMVFGHGLLGMPDDYLTRGGDSLGAMTASDRYGMIYAAAEWRGMSMRDQLDAATAARDFGQFNRVTDDLHMGVANFLAVGRMFKGGFADEPFLQASDGSGSLVDQDRIYYMGISLGGHQGGVTVALSDVFDFAILQVGGGPWTTMLERSSNWHDYSIIIDSWVRDPVDRQMLYAVSQMFWDPVDPATHWEDLSAKSVLLQESIGDAQVPNLSTEFWARSMGIPLVQPSATHPPLLTQVSAPTGPGASGLFQYDAIVHEACGEMPPDANIPAEDNCAHGIVRKTEAHNQQVEAFFAGGAEGTIIHPPACGTTFCSPAP